jgi:hypothetical protein
MAIPTKDVLLVDWSTNANTRLTANPATYGTTASVATQYDTLHDAYVLAYNNLVAARAAGTRSQSLTALKSGAKLALLNFARPLYKQIQANTAVTAAAKIELGVVVPNPEPTPQPVPAFAPGINIVSVNGRLVTIRLFDPAHPTRKRIPLGVDGATVMSFVGTEPPEDVRAFKYEGSTSKTTVQILFPESVAAGTQVWADRLLLQRAQAERPGDRGRRRGHQLRRHAAGGGVRRRMKAEG